MGATHQLTNATSDSLNAKINGWNIGLEDSGTNRTSSMRSRLTVGSGPGSSTHSIAETDEYVRVMQRNLPPEPTRGPSCGEPETSGSA